MIWERMVIVLMIGGMGLVALRLFAHYHRRSLNHRNDAPGEVRLLYFYGAHCAACALQARYLAQLDERFQALVQSIDAEQMLELTRTYNVLTVPTTILVDADGAVQHIHYGVTPTSKLTGQLESLLAHPGSGVVERGGVG